MHYTRSLYASGNPSSHFYYFADANGNVTYMLDGSQSLAASYRYDAFGNTISTSGTWSDNPYRFSSKEFLVNSGLYYFGFRFYDPSLQRWINRDPIEERGGLNLYAFLRNRCFDAIDPLGLGEWTLSIEKDDQSPWYHPNPLVTAKYLLGKSQAKCCTMYRIKRFARPHAIGAFGTLNWRFDGFGEIIGSTVLDVPAQALDQPGAKIPILGLVYPYVIDFRWEVYCFENLTEGAKLSEIEETIVILGNTGSWVGYGPDQTTIHISDGY